MKRLLYLFLFISSLSFSQEEISIIDFVKGDYPLNKKVKILYDKDWRPVIAIDSVDYYKIVKFKEKNIPIGKVLVFNINGVIETEYYADYLGFNANGVDSIFYNGPIKIYDAGNLSVQKTYINDKVEGDEIYYYAESGAIKMRGNYIDDKQHGLEYWYYESGNKMAERVYKNGILNGDFIRYNESGLITSSSKYVNGELQGQQKGYKNGILSYTVEYKNNLISGDQIFYYESGVISGKINYVKGTKFGTEFSYYETGEKEIVRKYINGNLEGVGRSYYKTGELDCHEN